jgi:MYXO-CTERM domain-containing protein
MKRTVQSLLGILAGLCIGMASQAATVTMAFSASGFQNAGVQFPGFDGPVSGSISWESTGNLLDPIAALTSIDLSIAGHVYTLAEVGIANQGTTQTAIGGLFNGANSAVGSGAAHDFLLVFDRVQPAITSFAYVIEGKAAAIWWTPTDTHAAFVTDANGVPEPSALGLAALAMGLLAAVRRRSVTEAGRG